MIKSFRVEDRVSARRGTGARVDPRNTETQWTEGKAEVSRNEAFGAVVERSHVDNQRQAHLACARARVDKRPCFMTRQKLLNRFQLRPRAILH
jgi:hypothetical protein